MKQKKLIISLSVVLVVIIGVMAALLILNRPQVQEGSKEIAVTVIHKDETQRKIDISTDAEFLGDALFEKKLVTQEEYETGFYTIVDGEKADYNVDASFWWLKVNGKDATTGANEIAISDGDEIEFKYTVG